MRTSQNIEVDAGKSSYTVMLSCSYVALNAKPFRCREAHEPAPHNFFPSSYYKVRRNSIKEGWSRQCLCH